MDSPNVLMKITERGGGDITSAKVGDPLELRFEIFDPESPYEIFVRDLVSRPCRVKGLIQVQRRGKPGTVLAAAWRRLSHLLVGKHLDLPDNQTSLKSVVL